MSVSLSSEIKSFNKEGGEALLVVGMPANYFKDVVKSVKYLCNNRNASGIYITLNRPCSLIIERLKKDSVRTENLVFVDVTVPGGESEASRAACFPISSPQALTEMAIAIDQLITNISGDYSFVVLDSLNTLFLYNKSDITVKFLHFLVNKVRLHNANTILFTTELEQRTKNLIAPLIDGILEVE